MSLKSSRRSKIAVITLLVLGTLWGLIAFVWLPPLPAVAGPFAFQGQTLGLPSLSVGANEGLQCVLCEGHNDQSCKVQHAVQLTWTLTEPKAGLGKIFEMGVSWIKGGLMSIRYSSADVTRLFLATFAGAERDAEASCLRVSNHSCSDLDKGEMLTLWAWTFGRDSGLRSVKEKAGPVFEKSERIGSLCFSPAQES